MKILQVLRWQAGALLRIFKYVTTCEISVKNKILEKLSRVETASDFSLLSYALVDTDAAALQDWISTVLIGAMPS